MLICFADVFFVLFMSPLRRHIFVCFLAKWGFFGPSSVTRGRTHIVLEICRVRPPLHTLKIWRAGVNSPRSYGAEFLFFLSVRYAKMLGTESL